MTLQQNQMKLSKSKINNNKQKVTVLISHNPKAKILTKTH